ncbi:MAG: hypothetical protein IT437_09465 [Phycisphaerales bacterium]|nr:hypothetical protein [Phycisphaerales bacterium]
MTLAQFLEHWRLTDNPFKGEEARHDPVFERMADLGDGAVLTHPEFDKVLGDPGHPASAAVFGEKGSGKTAIRLQIARRIAVYNAAHPNARCLLIPYDDFNPILDRFAARYQGSKTSPEETLKRLRHLDHLDAIVASVVPRIVDAVLGVAGPGEPLDLGGGGGEGAEPRRTARRMTVPLRRDLLILQAVYDRPEHAADRTAELRRTLRLHLPFARLLWAGTAFLGWIPLGLVLLWGLAADPSLYSVRAFQYTAFALLALWAALLFKRYAWDRLVRRRIARRLRRQTRVLGRTEASFMGSIDHLDDAAWSPGVLPTSDADDPRYAAVQRLRRVLAPFGYASVIVVVDRVDEPTLVRGDPERMRAVVWPMLSNKFLQQDGVGVKLLLPVELRHALFKESGAFFQEARLDKQNFIERLSWTGTMLYELCDARLRACWVRRDSVADSQVPRDSVAETGKTEEPPRSGGVPQAPPRLIDLFSDDVTRQDLVDALDQMHQPRDAFKMLYQCLTEHCSAANEGAWRIPRHVLDSVRKSQSDRVQQLYRGIRPA